jgi:uncharacterized protein YcbK (DUF882 family)
LRKPPSGAQSCKKLCVRLSATRRLTGLLIAIAGAMTPGVTETAVANGDTRTIYLHHTHTNEDIAATYLVNGQYDSNVLKQLNWFLRDWRRDEPTNMDPRLFDVVWEAYRGAEASNQVINVVSAYRSPETNAMLRSRSRAVAKYSQHMLGKAMDTTMPGLPMSHIREIGMRMQRGGVGYYPNANTPFVHLDVGNVRSWPRMTYEQLARLFPDGKTVHLPTNGQPLPRYEEARAEIEARGDGAYVAAPQRGFGGFFAMLFGGGEEDDGEIAAPPPGARKQWAALAPRRGREAEADGEEGGERVSPQIASAQSNLPKGETALSAADETGAPEAAGEAEETKRRPGRMIRAPLPPAGRPAGLGIASATRTNGGKGAGRETQDAEASVASNEKEATSAEEIVALIDAPQPPKRPARLVAGVSAAPHPPAKPAALHAKTGSDRAISKLVEKDKAGKKPTDDAPLAYVESTAAKTSAGAGRGGAGAGGVKPQRTKPVADIAAPGAPLGGVRSAAHALDSQIPASATTGFSKGSGQNN